MGRLVKTGVPTATDDAIGASLDAPARRARWPRRLLPLLCLAIGLVPALALVLVVLLPAEARARYEMWEGDRRVSAQEYGAALRRYTAAARASPRAAGPHLKAAALLWDQGRAEPAAEEWRAALDRDRANAGALLGLGRVAAARRELDQAAARYRAALSSEPNLGEARLELARALGEKGDFAAAQEELERLLTQVEAGSGPLVPDSRALRDQARYELALLLLLDRPGEAAGLLATALRATSGGMGPVSPDLLSDLLETANLAAGGKERGTGDDEGVAARLGHTYVRAEKVALARTQLERVVSVRPEDGDALAYLGHVYWRQGDSAQARQALRRAIDVAPDSALPRYFMGIVLRGEQRLEEAAAALRAAVERDPQTAALHLELARTLAAAADYAAAAEAFEQAAALVPGDLPTLLDAASFYLDHLFRVDRGLTLAAAAVRGAPTSAAAHDTMGWARHLNGDGAGALESLRQALALDPLLASAHLHLGVVLEQNRNLEGAAAAYRRAADLDVGRIAERAAVALRALADQTGR